MKKQKLLFLLPALGMALAGCGKKEEKPVDEKTPEEEHHEEQHEEEHEDPQIEHQNAFVRDIENVSVTREFDERFDHMVEDFGGATLNGETDAVVADSMLRVLVDNTSTDHPSSDDAAIYKMATGTYELQSYDSIGFKMRMVGNGALKLSNLVLSLRGDDAWKTYPIKLSEALDEDGEAMPTLSGEFKEFKIAPGQSIEDGETEYDLADGSAKSGTKVLDKILGFHLHALEEECSAILEISEVFIMKGGEKTVLDSFGRSAVNATDSTVWWRDSKGFIVQKGINLKGKQYKTPALEGDDNLVLNVVGDTTGVTLTTGDATVAWANLKDTEGNAVSNAVNGKYYPFVIDLAASGLAKDAQLTIASTTELNVASVYTTNMEVPQPVLEYPTFDTESVVIYDNFNRTQTGFNGDYDSAISNQQTIDAGLVYQLSYHNGEKVAVDGEALKFDGEGVDYVNYKVYNANVNFAEHDYLIFALKGEDGATLNDFRVNIGGAGVTYWNQWKSGEGLAAANLDQEGYKYVKDGFTWVIIDFEKSGLTSFVDSTLDYYYTGAGSLLVDFVAVADKEGVEYNEELIVEKSYTDQQGYDYAGYVYSPVGNQYIKLSVEGDATIDAIRFEGAAGAMYFHDGGYKDAEGNTISATIKNSSVVIDLVASGIKTAVDAEQGIHVHGDGLSGAVTAKVFVMTEKAKTQDTLYVTKAYAAQDGYAYAGYLYSPAGAQFMKLEVLEGTSIDGIRFEKDENPSAGAKWFHDNGLKDETGAVIPTDATGTILIDLVASGFKANANDAVGIHVHGDGSCGAVSFKLYSVDPISEEIELDPQAFAKVENLSGYNYVGFVETKGASKMKVTFTSEDAATLHSIRFEISGTEFCFKDGAIKDVDGNVISGETVISAEGTTFIIDLAASGITGGFHVHAGGWDSVTGSVTMSFAPILVRGTVAFILNSINA